MYPKRMLRQAFGLGMVVTLIFLALSGCAGGGQEQANESRSLPEYPQDLHAATYHANKFKPPVSFTVGKGWALHCPPGSDFVCLSRGQEKIPSSPFLTSTISTSQAGVGQ
jgi:hypothetical protein